MRLRALEGWRGLTALLVVVFHLLALHSFYEHAWLRNLPPVLDFFFMVSGFVMALGFSDKVKNAPDFWAFLVRRAGRVWPLHLAMLALVVALPLLHMLTGREGDPFWGIRSLDSLGRHVVLVQIWTPETALHWNFPAWTLSVEIFAYFLLALVLLVSVTARMRLALAGLIVAISGAVFLYDIEHARMYNVVAMSRGVFGFFAGFLVFELWKRFPLRQVRVAHVLEAAAALGFCALLVWPPSGPAYFLVNAVFALLIYTYASNLGFITKALSIPPLQWLGKVSFSMYLFHGVVVQWLIVAARIIENKTGFPLIARHGYDDVIAFPQQWMNDALLLFYVALVLTGAHFIFKFVEDPSRQYFSDVSKRVRAKLAAPTANRPKAPLTGAEQPT